MNGTRTPLRKGLQFGLVSGLVAGSLWGVLTYLAWSAAPEEVNETLASLLLALAGEFAFCFLTLLADPQEETGTSGQANRQ
jgi:hypothetical protein